MSSQGKKRNKPKKGNRSLRMRSDGQISLFADKQALKGQGRISRSARERQVKFCSGRPEGVVIGSRTLEEFLRERGHDEVFRLRRFLEQQDWSQFTRRYRAGGRPPYDPALMTGLIVFGIMEGKSSLRELEDLARFDVRVWWLTGGLCPDHSKIGRFINLHGETLSLEFFESVTGRILACSGGGKGDAAVDGTVVQAAASAYRTIREEAARQKAEQARQEAENNPEDEKAQQKADQAERVAAAVFERAEARRRRRKSTAHTCVSPSEPEAAVQRQKNRSVAPCYKPTVLADGKRIILGHAVHPTSETRLVGDLLDQAQRSGAEIGGVLGDGLFYDRQVMEVCRERDKLLLCPVRKDKKTGKFPRSMFCYHWLKDVYLCPGGHEMVPVNRTRRRKRPMVVYGKAPCAECGFRKLCTENKKGREIIHYEGDEEKQRLRQLMGSHQGKKRYRPRAGMVEPVYSVLKDRQGLRRFRRRGLAKVCLEWALHALAYNLGRYLVLTAPGAAEANRLLSTAKEAADGFFRRLAAVFSRVRPVLRPAFEA